MSKKKSQPDAMDLANSVRFAIQNRDEEIERLQAEVERLAPSQEYSTNLQRMIQRHCRGHKINSQLFDTSPYLAGLLNGFL